MNLRRTYNFISFLIICILLFSCETDESNDVEKERTIDSVKTQVSFESFVNSIPLETFPKNICINPFEICKAPRIEINSKFIIIPKDILNELNTEQNNLKNSIRVNPFFALSKMYFQDSLISIRCIHSTNQFKKGENTFQFLITYNKDGKILSVLPTNYHKTESKYITTCISMFNKNNRITKYYLIEDTTQVLFDSLSKYHNNYHNYHRKEFAESLTVKKDGKIGVLKKKTNVLESFAKTYVKVGIEDKRFRVYNPCNDTFHIINFIPPNNSEYYTFRYKDENQEFNYEIVYSGMIGTCGIQNEFDWDFRSGYIHLWLRDIETGEYNKSFTAIGSSGDKRVLEFPFNGKYYTDYQNVITGRIKIQRPDCD